MQLINVICPRSDVHPLISVLQCSFQNLTWVLCSSKIKWGNLFTLLHQLISFHRFHKVQNYFYFVKIVAVELLLVPRFLSYKKRNRQDLLENRKVNFRCKIDRKQKITWSWRTWFTCSLCWSWEVKNGDKFISCWPSIRMPKPQFVGETMEIKFCGSSGWFATLG